MVYAYADISIQNSIIYFNEIQDTWSNASVNIYFSNVQGVGGSESLDSDPLFMDNMNGDFSLQAQSPCIDTGNPDQDNDGEDYTTDVDDQDPDGTRLDMGAYYFNQNLAPIPEISSSSTSPTNISSIPILVIFSESVTGFESSDIMLSNATVSDFSGNGSEYTMSLSPLYDGLVTFDIPAGTSQGSNGSNNLASEQYSIEYDGTRPDVLIVSSVNSPFNSTPFNGTIIFSEPVLQFNQDDLIIDNIQISQFSGDDSLYNFSALPIEDGEITIVIPEDITLDYAGNNNNEIFKDS